MIGNFVGLVDFEKEERMFVDLKEDEVELGCSIGCFWLKECNTFKSKHFGYLIFGKS